MARRFLRTLPRRTLQVVGALLVLAVVAFFALTRTEVGRRQLARQIEAQFDERFAGTLRIGELTGTLVGTIYARDVRVEGPGGQTMLAVDSVRAVPRWRSLLNRQVFFSEVELVEPRASLVRSPGGSWNVARAFRRAAPRDTTGASNTFALRFTDVVVRNGDVRTQNQGAAPRLVRQGWLFDYADARLSALDARLSFERTEQDGTQVEFRRLSGRLGGTAGVPVTDARGQLTVSGGTVALRPLHLRLGQTALQGTFSLERRADAAPGLNVALRESRLDHDELRRLVPRWPLRGTTTAALVARGPLDRLAVERLRVARGQSRVRAEGSVRGLPDALAFDVAFSDSRLTAADLRAVVPALPPRQTQRLARVGAARFSLSAEGRVADLAAAARELRVAGRFDISTAHAGALRGTAEVQRRGNPPALSYTAEVEADNFAAGRLSETGGRPTRLNGTLSLSGEGTTPKTLTGTLDAQLAPSVVAGRPLDGLDARLRASRNGRATGTATLRQRGGGRLYVSGTVERRGGRRTGGVPAYDLAARSERLDLGALLGRDSLATALTGTAEVDGRGASLGTLAGQLRVALDSSTVTRSDGEMRTLPPLTPTLTLAAPDEAGPRITLRSEAADLTVTGEADLTVLRALGTLWGRAFASAFREAYRKPYRPAATPPDAPPPAVPGSWPAARAAVQRALQRSGLGDVAALRAGLRIKQPALLQRFAPGLPAGRSDTIALDLGLHAGAQTFEADGTFGAQHVRAGRFRAVDAEGQISASASLEAPLLDTFRASFDASADTLALGGTRFEAPALAASFRDREGDLQLSTSAAGARLQTGATLQLLPHRNRLRIRTLRLAAGNYRWQSADPGPVDLYADAVAVRGLSLVGPNRGGGPPQRVSLRGTLSGASQDTLFAEVERVRLGALSRVLGRERRLGGRLGAQVALTGGLGAPQLTGRLDVARFALEDDLVGHLTARSRYVPGSERVAFDAQVRPAATPQPDSSALVPQENHLTARGTVALPGSGDAPGTLDLSLDVERADLFFFNHIFRDKIEGADGALSGSGHIGGTFRDPLFQADFRIADGSFRIPRFGLRYDVSGPVSVDAEGIKVDGARVTDPSGGSARIDGALLFNDYEYFSFDLRAALDELRVIDVADSPTLPFFGQIAGSGTVRIDGPIYDASLTAPGGVRTTPESELVIPIEESDGRGGGESGFLIFADSTGRLPDLRTVTRREGILAERPEGERSFVDGLDLDLGIDASAGSTVRLVFDPLLGDEITAVGGGAIQIVREEGDLSLFGTFDVSGGSYLFTAGQVFQRRFQIEGGTLRWDGSAANAALDLAATYRTRASRAGLPGAGTGGATGRIPIIVRLDVGGRVQQPSVDLSLAVDQEQRGFNDYSTAGLETMLNREDSGSEYATSVLLTNTFLLTTDLAGRAGSGQSFSETGNRLAFNSVSQLVSSQLNRYLDEAIPSLDVNLGVQGENPQNLDVVYGAALRLLDERLLIRGEGVLNGENGQRSAEGFQGEFVVEVRLTPRVSAEAFFRREGSIVSDRALTSTTGAGLSYETEYSTWQELWHRLFGWLGARAPKDNRDEPEEGEAVAAE